MTRSRPATLLLLLAALVAAAVTFPAVTSPARADDQDLREDRSTTVVVGPTELAESGLWRRIASDYLRGIPFGGDGDDYSFQYVGLDSAAAIERARTGGAALVIVDAPDLERRLVADGYVAPQYDGRPGRGRVTWWTDYVLLGSKADRAAVRERSPRDLVAAFERVARYGAAGRARFVSRADRTDTTQAENALWALTSGVRTCTVSAADGGGETPSLVTGPCPGTIPRPGWFRAVQADHATTLRTADYCGGAPTRSCYVLSDRGLSAAQATAGRIDRLRVVGTDAGTTASRRTATVQSFRAYAIDADRFPEVSMDWSTGRSMAGYLAGDEVQGMLGRFLRNGGTAPYRPASLPVITASTSPRTVSPGGTFVASGYLASRLPGAARLDGAVVSLQTLRRNRYGENVLTTVAQARADARGVFRIRYEPERSASYVVVVDDPDHAVDRGDPPLVVTYGSRLVRVPAVRVQALRGAAS